MFWKRHPDKVTSGLFELIVVGLLFFCIVTFASVSGLSDQPIKVENPYSESCPGILTITSSPPGATVFIDSAARGTTPLERIRILSGRHTVRLTMNGYIDTTDDLTVLCDTTATKQYTLRPILITTTTPVPAAKIPAAKVEARALVTANIPALTEATKAVPAQKNDREQQAVPAQGVPAQVVPAQVTQGPGQQGNVQIGIFESIINYINNLLAPSKCGVKAQCYNPDSKADFCSDLKSDFYNCGACGNHCKDYQDCINGVCGCTDGLTDCGDMCADIKTDDRNCGSCYNKCSGIPGSGGSALCADGRCIMHTCSNGLVYCYGSCIDPQTDTSNCGYCGMVCRQGQGCVAGTCKGSGDDWENCGGPGIRCTGNTDACCNGRCVDSRSDPANCGGCGDSCGSGLTCLQGYCMTPAPSVQLPVSVVEIAIHGGDNPGTSYHPTHCEIGIYNHLHDGDLVGYAYQCNLQISTQNIDPVIRQEISEGKRKVFLSMHVKYNRIGSETATNRESALGEIKYAGKDYLMDLPTFDGYGGKMIPPAGIAKRSGPFGHFNSGTKVITVDISDIVRAWIAGSTDNTGLDLLWEPFWWGQPSEGGESTGFITEYDGLTVTAVHFDTSI